MSNTTVQTKHAGDPFTNTEVNDMVAAINSKQDAIDGKQLTDQNYTLAEKQNLAKQSGTNTGDQDLSGLVVKINGKGLSTNDLTDDRASKLDALSEHYVGNYPSLASLQAAHAVGQAGQYATVDVAGQDAQTYIWDVTDSIWVASSSTAGAVTSVNSKTGAVTLGKSDVGLGQVPNIDATDRINHTGTQSADTIVNGVNNKVYTATEKVRLNNPDVTPTSLSANLVTSGGVYDMVQAAIPLLRVETVNYVNRIKAVGGSIDNTTINAIDTFFATGSQDGWLSLFKANGEIGGGIGDNLVTSLVKILPGSGLASSLVNENFVESDYTKKFGYKLLVNTNKRLRTGINYTNLGLNYANFSVGAFFVDDTPISYSVLGDNPASGVVLIGSGLLLGIGTYAAGRAGGAETIIASFSATGMDATRWGVPANRTVVVPSSYTLNTEITLFSTTANSVQRFSTGSLGFYCIGPSLTLAQSTSLGNAITKLMSDIGRMSSVGSLAKWIGDSNTQGLGVVNNYDKFSSIVSRNIGARQINYGSGGQKVTGDTTVSFAAMTGLSATNLNFGNFRFILEGTNDELQDGDATSVGTPATIATFKSNLDVIVKSAITLREKVVLITTPYNENVTSNQTKTKAYNTAIKEVALANNVPLVNLYTKMVDTGAPLTLLQADKLHLLESGHLLLATEIINVVNGRMVRDITIDVSSVPAQGVLDIAISEFLSAKVGQLVDVIPNSPVSGLNYSAFVSSSDVVTLRVSNITSTAIDPPSMVYRFAIFI